MPHKQRDAFRLEFTSKVTCRTTSDSILTGKLRDISATGCYMEVDNPPDLSGSCSVNIIIVGQKGRLRIEDIMGEIARVDDTGVAIKFNELFEWLSLVPINAVKTKTTSEDLALEIVKTAVENNQVLVNCPNCQLSRMVPADKFPDRTRKSKIKCRCGYSFLLSLEYRQQPRKATELKGTFTTSAGETNVKVLDLSHGGVRLEMLDGHALQVGDKGSLQFRLDNHIQSTIMELVVVRNIKNLLVGCQFDDEKPFRKELGFYLLG